MGIGIRCKDCGNAELIDRPGLAKPCPGCGSTSRSIFEEVGLSAEAGLSARYEEGFMDQLDRLGRYWMGVQFEDDWPRLHPDEHLDYVYSFFQNCYHLKDWIKNDPKVSEAAKNAVEEFISGDDSLSLCADIANASKHLRLTKPPRSDKDPYFYREEIERLRGPRRVKFFVAAKGEPELDALALARKCLEAWQKFLADNDLWYVNLTPTYPIKPRDEGAANVTSNGTPDQKP
jgi:hypothetical protein